MLSNENTGNLSDISNTAISLRMRNTAGDTASVLAIKTIRHDHFMGLSFKVFIGLGEPLTTTGFIGILSCSEYRIEFTKKQYDNI